jgi:hypothetical protein
MTESAASPKRGVGETYMCEVERYTVHKHFYGKRVTKFHKMLIQKGKRSGFYTVVSITVSTGQVRPLHFDDT